MAHETSLFVGGCYRSGTTLLEKLLHQHDDVCVASQPFPDLYFYTKSLFDRERGLERRYPLGHRFLDRGYESDELHEFLDARRLTEGELAEMLDRLAANRLGLWTPEILRERGRVRVGTFWQIYRQLNRLAAEIHGKDGCTYLGGKEVLCEEYVPYLLGRGGRAILVVRDPRDMISSLDFRRRDNKTGDDRPVLFSLRIWRKSVAICLAFADHPGFAWLRYEDLANDPRGEMRRLAEFLEIEPLQDSALAGRHQEPGWHAVEGQLVLRRSGGRRHELDRPLRHESAGGRDRLHRGVLPAGDAVPGLRARGSRFRRGGDSPLSRPVRQDPRELPRQLQSRPVTGSGRDRPLPDTDHGDPVARRATALVPLREGLRAPRRDGGALTSATIRRHRRRAPGPRESISVEPSHEGGGQLVRSIFRALVITAVLASLSALAVDAQPRPRASAPIDGWGAPLSGALATDPVIYDNGVAAPNTGLSSQLDTAYPFDSQVADDFSLPTGAGTNVQRHRNHFRRFVLGTPPQRARGHGLQCHLLQ